MKRRDMNTAAASTRLGLRTAGGWRNFFAVVPAVGTSLLPLGLCPVCWPAYVGLLGTVGLGFLMEATYLLPVMIALLGLALVSLAYRAGTRRGYGPFTLGIVAAALVLVGKFTLFSNPLVYLGLALLMGASVWNSWPHKAAATGSCPACAPQEPVLDR